VKFEYLFMCVLQSSPHSARQMQYPLCHLTFPRSLSILIFFSITLGLCSSYNVRDQISFYTLHILSTIFFTNFRNCKIRFNMCKENFYMIIIIDTNKCTIISLLNIHHAYMFRPNWSSSGHLQDQLGRNM
jgi:hypothetical protein